MTTTAIRTVVLYVADPARSRHFYADLLGLPVTGEVHGRIELNADGIRLLLHPTDVDAIDQREARHGRVEVYFATDDVDSAVSTLRGHGVEILQEPIAQPWGERDAAVLDPDGFTVFLTQVM
ncbi:MAG: VOC family protein [Actinomycetota bacterium]|nr:VOC family protein [Actinomycetota bacterium]